VNEYNSVPDRVKPSSVIFDIRTQRQSARMSKITTIQHKHTRKLVCVFLPDVWHGICCVCV